MRLIDYIRGLAREGSRSFTTQSAIDSLEISPAALNMSISRLLKKGGIASPAKHFYVIIPAEHQNQGCLPAHELTPLLMEYWQLDYYVCLLSAAAMHGATHQAVQRFYVMIESQRNTVKCGKVTIDFIVKKTINSTPKQQFTVKTGYLNVSTPEATAMDLIVYPQRSGGPNHIATVLTELIEVIDPKKLLALASTSQSASWVQRLGYYLENIEPLENKIQLECVTLLKNLIKEKRSRVIPLVGTLKNTGYLINKDWDIIVNFDLESDI